MTDARWVAKASALWLAWERRTGGPPPSMNALELGLAQAEFETSCGDAWPSSHNWGACDLRSLNATELAAFKAGGLKDGMWLLPGDTWSATWDASATGQTLPSPPRGHPRGQNQGVR